MSSVKVKMLLSKQQMSKLRSAKKNNRPVSIRFSNEQIFNQQGQDIEVSAEQYKKLLSASKSKAKRGATISFSASQVQSGGFLPLLACLLGGPLINGIVNATQGKNFFTGEGLKPLGSQVGRGRKRVAKKKMIPSSGM